MNDGIRNGILIVISVALWTLVMAVDRLTDVVHRAQLAAEHPPTMHVFVEPSPTVHVRVVP